MTISENNNTMLKNAVCDYCNKQELKFEKIKQIVSNVPDFHKVEFSSNKLIDFNDYRLEKVLYYFELADHSHGISGKTICNKISDRKRLTDNKLKLPQVNFCNVNDRNKMLYVGKSIGLFSTRLKQHFSFESDKTYALHLGKWQDIIGGNVKLTLYYRSYKEIIKDEENDLLELIETSLHNKLKPLLGRTGH